MPKNSASIPDGPLPAESGPILHAETTEVLLDANGLRSIGWPELNAAGGRLIELLRRLRITMGLPDVAVAEARGLFEREVSGGLQRLESARRKLDQLLANHATVTASSVEQYLRAYDAKAAEVMGGNPIVVHRSAAVDAADLLSKWARRVAPFNVDSPEKGWRDSLILNSIKQLANDGRPRLFVTHDGDFLGGPATELGLRRVTVVRTVDAAIRSLEGLLNNEERQQIRQRDKAILRLLQEHEESILAYLRAALRIPPHLFPAGTLIDAISIDRVTPTKPLVYEDNGERVLFAFAARVEITYAGRTAQFLERSDVPVLEARDRVVQRSAIQSALLPNGLMSVPAEAVISAAHILVRLTAEATRVSTAEFSGLNFTGADALLRVDNLRVQHELMPPPDGSAQ